MFYEKRDILWTFTKWRDLYSLKICQSIIKILQQFSFFNRTLWVLLQCHDKANVNWLGPCPAYAACGSFIHERENFHLIPKACFFNLLNENGSTVCDFEETPFRSIWQPFYAAVVTE